METKYRQHIRIELLEVSLNQVAFLDLREGLLFAFCGWDEIAFALEGPVIDLANKLDGIWSGDSGLGIFDIAGILDNGWQKPSPGDERRELGFVAKNGMAIRLDRVTAED